MSSSRKSQAVRHFSASGPGLRVERALALEQRLVLALEHRDQQALLAAEVVVDEREADARPRSATARVLVPPCAVLDEHVARRVEDPVRRVACAADGPAVDLRRLTWRRV